MFVLSSPTSSNSDYQIRLSNTSPFVCKKVPSHQSPALQAGLRGAMLIEYLTGKPRPVARSFTKGFAAIPGKMIDGNMNLRNAKADTKTLTHQRR